MTSLHIALLIAGVLLVLAVVLYNVLQERAVKRRQAASADTAPRQTAHAATSSGTADAAREPAFHTTSNLDTPTASASFTSVPPREAPDFMAEAVLTLQLPEFASITTELAQQILKTPGKQVRILWQPQGASAWTALRSAQEITALLGDRLPPAAADNAVDENDTVPIDHTTSVHSLSFCLQLADRAHVVTPEQLDAFQKHVEGIASLLSASYTPFDVSVEAERARALDQACAQVDLQIGLTLHGKVGPLPGQQLLQAAQKQGFVLEQGALRCLQNGRELFRIESHDGAPLTEERLQKAIQDPVLLLDVPQTRQPEHSFDELLKNATKLAQALSAQLVDDRQRPVNDQGLQLIRAEVTKAAQAMRNLGIEPGSTRALRLFSV